VRRVEIVDIGPLLERPVSAVSAMPGAIALIADAEAADLLLEMREIAELWGDVSLSRRLRRTAGHNLKLRAADLALAR
jgi:hypothetical protein